MCGRVVLNATIEELASRFRAQPDLDLAWEPHFNVPPKTDLGYPIVIIRDSMRILKPALWGLLPPSAQDMGVRLKYSTFNAKIETLAVARSYAPSVMSNQFCLVPVTGFYEWFKTPESRQPILVRRRGQSISALAGIWARWRSGNQEWLSFSIITTPANSFMRPIHTRMPLLLPNDVEDFWVHPQTAPIRKIEVGRGVQSGSLLDAYPVSKTIVNGGTDVAQCIEPIGETLEHVLQKKC